MTSVAVELVGSNLHIGQHIINLQTRSKTFALVEALAGGGNAIDRDRLRTRVYESPEEISERLRISQNCSLNKLISRTRNFLMRSLQGAEISGRIQWFVYCGRQKTWSLYHLGTGVAENDIMNEDVL